jgi:hypothetical protein
VIQKSERTVLGQAGEDRKPSFFVLETRGALNDERYHELVPLGGPFRVRHLIVTE